MPVRADLTTSLETLKDVGRQLDGLGGVNLTLVSMSAAMVLATLWVASRRGRRHSDFDDSTDYLSWFVVAAFFGMIVLLVFHGLPPTSAEAVLILIGQASGGFTAVMGYRYGTTQGSGRKDSTIVNLARALPSDSTPPKP